LDTGNWRAIAGAHRDAKQSPHFAANTQSSRAGELVSGGRHAEIFGTSCAQKEQIVADAASVGMEAWSQFGPGNFRARLAPGRRIV
jgi:hypothetical protein